MARRLKATQAHLFRRTAGTAGSGTLAVARRALQKGSSVEALRILIVDDHESVRLGLQAMIESHPEWTVCGEAGTGREAVEKAKELKPDVVIMDITMPDLNGLEATRQIAKAVPQTEVLVFSMHQSEQLLHDALKAGARGYVSKAAGGRELKKALAAMARHKPFFSDAVQIPAPGSHPKRLPQEEYVLNARSPLSPREREVLQLLAEGKTSKQIAETLDLSTKTVEAHRANMLCKLDLHSTATLIRYAIRNGIVPCIGS